MFQKSKLFDKKIFFIRESVDSSGKISLNSRTKLMQQNSGQNKFQGSFSCVHLLRQTKVHGNLELLIHLF